MKKRFLLIIALLGLLIPFNVFALDINVDTDEGVKLLVDLDANDSIESVKDKIFDQFAIPKEKQILIYNNKILLNNRTIDDYNIVNGQTIYLRYGAVELGDELLYDNLSNTANTASYDYSKGLLKLKGYDGKQIVYYGEPKLTITLEDDNKITTVDDSFMGIRTYTDLKINGSGSLTISNATNGILVNTGSLEIDGVKIVVEDALFAGISVEKNLTMNCIFESHANMHGLYVQGKVQINGGKIDIVSTRVGILSADDIDINDGTVDISAGEEDFGIAIITMYIEGEHKINLSDKLYVVQEGVSIQKPRIIDDSMSGVKGYTFGKPGAVFSNRETQNIAYVLSIKPKYKVVFNTNEGSIVHVQYVIPNNKAIIPENPTKGGYTFAGWYKDAELNNSFDFETEIVEDITLYAKWTNKNPATGDNINSSIIMSSLSLITLIISVLYIKKNTIKD